MSQLLPRMRNILLSRFFSRKHFPYSKKGLRIRSRAGRLGL
ncbi:hypothetical protein LMG27952_02643 [Paraburkholderia hiiakae]|uniref:Uncharacterized protein n=1 Tax=Paraburkholderia hiiakae TaxID=1081782 RepID=A0ABM8NM07_9BURK|nr:hypothetical protein LMG27952_02643 [Paraburkholderia hiiakae]